MSEEYKRGYKQAVEDVVNKMNDVIRYSSCRNCPADKFCDEHSGGSCIGALKIYLLKEVEG